MEPRVSLWHLQVPSTCPYPETDQFSHPPLSNFLIDLNIILPYMPGSSKWSLSLRFPHQNAGIPLLSPHTCYMPCPCHSFGFDHPNTIWWTVQIIKLLIIWFFPLPFYLIPFRLNCAPSLPILKHPQPTFLPQFEWPSLTPIQNNRQNYSSLYLNLCVLDSSLDDKKFLDRLQSAPNFFMNDDNILSSVYVSMH